MGKSSSAKKVARAARAGGSSGGADKREFGFPLVIAAVFLVGTAGIVAAKTTQSARADIPALGEHWHSAYEIVACGEALPGALDADGGISHIHAHAGNDGITPDGLIHIHPQSSAFTGDNASLGAFFEKVGIDLDDDSLEMPDGTVYDEEEGCDGEDATLRVARWENGPNASGTADDIFDSRLARTRLSEDLQAFTIFFGPSDADIPAPSTAGNIANASDVAEPTILDPSLFEDAPEGDADAGTDDSGAETGDGDTETDVDDSAEVEAETPTDDDGADAADDGADTEDG